MSAALSALDSNEVRQRLQNALRTIRARRVRWDDALDAQLRDLRRSGLTWDAIAETMGAGRNTVLERARKIGVRTAIAKVQPPPVAPREHLDRAPKAAGDADTWGAIVVGTCMAGALYSRPHDPPPSPVCLHDDGCVLRSVPGFSYCAGHRARIYCVEV